MRRHTYIPLLIPALLLPALTIAQYQVNRQVAAPGASQSVRFQGSIQNKSATFMTPAQSTMAVRASGATPSELKTNYNRIGPGSPSGAIAYIPPPPSYTAPKQMATGNYVNTQASAGSRNVPASGGPPAARSSSPAYGAPISGYQSAPSTSAVNGSVRCSGSSMPAGTPAGAAPYNSAWSFLAPAPSGAPVAPTNGSVHYAP